MMGMAGFAAAFTCFTIWDIEESLRAAVANGLIERPDVRQEPRESTGAVIAVEALYAAHLMDHIFGMPAAHEGARGHERPKRDAFRQPAESVLHGGKFLLRACPALCGMDRQRASVFRGPMPGLDSLDAERDRRGPRLP